MSEHSETKRQGGANRALLIGSGVVIVALLCVVGYMGWMLTRPAPEPVEEDIMTRGVVVTEENVEEIVEEMDSQPPLARPDGYEVSMTTTWNFPDGASASSDAFVENVTDNSNDVYFDLLLADTEEVIYESPVIPVGARLTQFALSKDLDAGSYPCVIEYHLLDEQQRTLGTLRMTVTVNVNG